MKYSDEVWLSGARGKGFCQQIEDLSLTMIRKVDFVWTVL